MGITLMRLARVVLAVFLVMGTFGPSEAAFKYGEPTDGYKVKVDGSELKFRFRLQPRFDFGHVSDDGDDYNTDSDFYMRRIRFETSGQMMKDLSFKLVFAGDKWDKNQQTSSLDVYYAYVDYKFAKLVTLRMGKHKLPLSRVSLTSSSKQLLIERPVTAEAEKDFFGDSNQFIVAFHESINNNSINYIVAVADGWDPADTSDPDAAIFDAEDFGGVPTDPDSFVTDSENLLLAKLTFSPKGWEEKGQSDAHLGKGQHLTFGAHVALQKSIKHEGGIFGSEDDRRAWGVEISGHIKNVTLQYEIIRLKNTSTSNLVQFKASGWYVQGGYFVPQANIELVARYEIFDENINSPSYETETRTVGANWYGKGHSYKLGINWVHSQFDSNVREVGLEDEKNVFQTQAQFYF